MRTGFRQELSRVDGFPLRGHEREKFCLQQKKSVGFSKFFSAHKKIEKNCRTRLCANICRSQSEFTYVDSNVGLKFIFPLFIKKLLESYFFLHAEMEFYNSFTTAGCKTEF